MPLPSSGQSLAIGVLVTSSGQSLAICVLVTSSGQYFINFRRGCLYSYRRMAYRCPHIRTPNHVVFFIYQDIVIMLIIR